MNNPLGPEIPLKSTEVLIVGGGVIGLSIAYELSKKNIKVIVLEKGKLGHGCSYGNAGWLTPCFAMPLAMPGLLLKSMKWLLDSESPLYIKPSLHPDLANWLIRFVRAMNWTQANLAIEALVQLSTDTLSSMKALDAQFPGKLQFDQKGLIMISQTAKGTQAIHEELRLVSQFGVRGQELSPKQILVHEPGLKGELHGGAFFPDEAHVEPMAVVNLLRSLAENNGVEIIENCEAQVRVESDSQKIIVSSQQFQFKAEKIVLATGSWSKAIGKLLRLPIPVMGGKGYAMIFPPLAQKISHPIMMLERKLAITPREGSIRIAGTLELVDQDFSITQRRVQAMIKGAQSFLELPADPQIVETWKGLRPCTPDGVPMLGKVNRFKNLYLACGHQMLGLQTSLGTGKYMAQTILETDPFLKTKVFDPNRF